MHVYYIRIYNILLYIYIYSKIQLYIFSYIILHYITLYYIILNYTHYIITKASRLGVVSPCERSEN